MKATILNTADLETARGHVVADLRYSDKSGLRVVAIDGSGYAIGSVVAQGNGESATIEALIAKGVNREAATKFVTE